jgi:hypothetical protein
MFALQTASSHVKKRARSIAIDGGTYSGVQEYNLPCLVCSIDRFHTQYCFIYLDISDMERNTVREYHRFWAQAFGNRTFKLGTNSSLSNAGSVFAVLANKPHLPQFFYGKFLNCKHFCIALFDLGKELVKVS